MTLRKNLLNFDKTFTGLETNSRGQKPLNIDIDPQRGATEKKYRGGKSSILYPLSSILYPLSSILYPLSSILYPLSSILYPLSSILYPLSSILYPLSSILYPLSSSSKPLTKASLFPSFSFRLTRSLWAGVGLLLALLAVVGCPITEPGADNTVAATNIVIEGNNPLSNFTTTPDGSATTGTLTAVVLPNNHTEGDVVWASDNENVLTVASAGANTATYTAKGAGSATVTASVGSVSNTLNVVLRDRIPATSVMITGKNPLVIATTNEDGSATTGTLTALVSPDNHDDGQVAWSSDDASVLTVASVGANTATYTTVGEGTATVTAMVGDVSTNISVQVKIPVPATSIAINQGTTITVTNTFSGTSGMLSATVTPADHTDGNVSWVSLDESKLTLSPTVGSSTTYTTVNSSSTVTVTASVDDGRIETNIEINLVPALSIAIDQGPAITVTNTASGTSGTLTATVTPADYTNEKVMWASSDTNILTLSPTEGSTTTYTTVNSSGTVTVTASVDGGRIETNIVINLVPAIEISSNAFTVGEDISDTNIIGNVGAIPFPGSGTFSYAIAANSEDLFDIDAMGNISLSNGAELDFEETNQHVIEVSVSVGGFTENFSVTIGVEDVLFFVERTGGDNPFPGDFGLSSSPQFVDFYGDGNLFLYLEDNTSGFMGNPPVFFSNTASGWSDRYTNFALWVHTNIGLLTIRGRYYLIDYDGDDGLEFFFLDYIIGTSPIYYFENVSNTYTNQTSPLPVRSEIADIAFHDLDGDSNVDVFYGLINGRIAYYSNTNGGYVEHTGAANPFDGIDVGDDATLVFVDVDKDLDVDLVCGARNGFINYFENTGNNTYIKRTNAANPFTGINVNAVSYPTFGDVDGDGLSGSGGGEC